MVMTRSFEMVGSTAWDYSGGVQVNTCTFGAEHVWRWSWDFPCQTRIISNHG